MRPKESDYVLLFTGSRCYASRPSLTMKCLAIWRPTRPNESECVLFTSSWDLHLQWSSRLRVNIMTTRGKICASTSKIKSEKRCLHMSCISEGSDTWGYLGELPMCTCPMRSEGSWTRSRRSAYWSATRMNRRVISVITPRPNKFEWAEMSYMTSPHQGTCLRLQPPTLIRSLRMRPVKPKRIGKNK